MNCGRGIVLMVLLSLIVASGCYDAGCPEIQGVQPAVPAQATQPRSLRPSDLKIQVTIDDDGRYTVEGHRRDVVELEDSFGKLKGTAKHPSIHIHCSGACPFSMVQPVIDAAWRLRISAICLRTTMEQESVPLSGICGGPWPRPVLVVRVFPQRLTVNGKDPSLLVLNELLHDNPEHVAFIRPQEGAQVSDVYSVLRTCEANTDEFGLASEDAAAFYEFNAGDRHDK